MMTSLLVVGASQIAAYSTHLFASNGLSTLTFAAFLDADCWATIAQITTLGFTLFCYAIGATFETHDVLLKLLLGLAQQTQRQQHLLAR